MSVAGVESHVKARIEALRAAMVGHANATAKAASDLVSGKAIGDLTNIAPLQAVVDVAKDVSDAILEDFIGGNLDVTFNHIKRQLQITRDGRI